MPILGVLKFHFELFSFPARSQTFRPASSTDRQCAYGTQVGDFGLSKVKELQKIAGTYRMTGKTGSMRYMAPEVFQDDPNYDEKVDIYSTGLILWYIALGERPFDRVPAEVGAILKDTKMYSFSN